MMYVYYDFIFSDYKYCQNKEDEKETIKNDRKKRYD